MPRERAILHVDMDAFFASVEQRDNPALKGKPVLVGGTENRGVVAAASYEARRFGVRSAMPIREALQRCPEAICVRSSMDRYQQVSRQVFEIFRSVTPDVEGLSVDEAFLDVSASRDLFGTPVTIAHHLKQQILAQTQLTASVGVATNKLVAKIASDLDKPNGLTVIEHGEEATRLAGLPAAVLPGIGPRMQTRLKAVGIVSIRDLQQASNKQLEQLFGRFAGRVRERAFGRDARPVIAWREEKSVSSENTFREDLRNEREMHNALRRLSDKTGERLRSKQLLAGVVQIKIRRSDFVTATRQISLAQPSNVTKLIFDAAVQLLSEWRQEQPDAAIRLLGVGTAKLTSDQQLNLFGEMSREDSGRVDRTVDAVRERFSDLGRAALQPASTLDRSDSDSE